MLISPYLMRLAKCRFFHTVIRYTFRLVLFMVQIQGIIRWYKNEWPKLLVPGKDGRAAA